jgi:hypothetical protein
MAMTETRDNDPAPAPAAPATATRPAEAPPRPKEIGGPSGPEPTRYGDWERKGRVSDF